MANEIAAEVHPDPADYWVLAPEWKELLGQTGETSPFLMPLWVGLSYEYFGGERLSFLISLRDRDGKLVGIAPLAIVPAGNTVRFAVDSRLTDYADLVIAPAARVDSIAKIVETIRDFMGGERFGVVLEPVRGNSPNLLALEQALGGQSRMTSAHLAIKLPQNPDEFLYRVLRPEDRKSLLRRESRLTRSHEIEVECLTEPMEVSDNLDDLLWMFVAESPEKKGFMTPEREAFLREVMPLAAKEGSCRLYYIKVDGARVAGHLVLENRETVFVYMSAEGAVGAELSAGILLLKSITENAIERGFFWLDFGRGGEEYKRKLGAKEGKVYRLMAGEPSGIEEDGGKPENLMQL